MKLTGLSSAEVAKKTKQGKVNVVPAKNKNTVGKIILTSTFTIFNLVNLILALMIIYVGAYKNLLFLLIAIANTLISIINGIRAKITIDKMRLVAEQRPAVIRDGKTIQIPASEIVEGDLMIYSLGDQILVDSKIEQGNIEVNESFITGEQDNVAKRPGDNLISGSFVVSGTCYATAVKVGAASHLAKLESDARTIKATNSKLFTIINNIVKYISYALIPIGALLLWSRFRVGDTTPEIAVTSTVAGLISMIPEGLVLLTSSVLALATIRLSRKKVLVQDLYSVETLARVDCIALDKTGTLTTGKMTVHDYTPTKNSFERALLSILSHQTSENATIIALKQKFLKNTKFKEIEGITDVISFSSERKHSGIRTKDATYLLGAVEFLTDDQGIIKQVKSASGGYRTLAIVKSTSVAPSSSQSTKSTRQKPQITTELLGYIRLQDELRSDAKDIINYFYDNDIDVKIISGDELETVKTIASRVGVRSLEAVELSSSTTHNYAKLTSDYSIFTRVTPSQKKQLIQALKAHGKTVAMTGDGVNDILAMKEADVSIAIGEGSDAARRTSKIVLMGSNFSSVPAIIDEGRQSINNLERSATLFLSKNAYAAILAVLFIIIPIQYPYAPIEMSLLNTLCIGIPGLALALEKNTARIKDQFVKNIKRYSIPTSLMVASSMLILSIVAENANLPRGELLSLSAVITFTINLTLIYRISRPLNLFRATLLTIITILFVFALLFPASQHLFDFSPLF